jgi:type VI secretion system secreted protein VgrG
VSLLAEDKRTQHDLGVVIKSPFGEDDLLLCHLVVEEAISRPFRLTVGMLSPRLDLDPKEILGKPLSITLRPPAQYEDSMAGPGAALLGGGEEPKSRYFSGIVTSFSTGAAMVSTHSDEGGFRAYNAEVVSRFGMLNYTTTCRIFQEKTVVQIIETVLQDHGLSSGQDYSVADVSGPLTKRKWDYCVQYNETDLQFVSRLMEQTGIYYYFEHEEDKHKLVLSDKAALDIRTHDMVFRVGSTAAMAANEISSWENRFLFITGKRAISDFDYRNTASDLQADVTTTKGHAETKEHEHFEYPILYQTSKLDEYGTKSDGSKLAELHMLVLDSQRHLILSSSKYRELVPGHLINVSEQSRGTEEEGQTFLVVSVRHEMEQDPVTTGALIGTLKYANTFTCLPSTIPYQPPRITPKPRMSGPQTAIVIGAQAFSASDKSDQEVMTDKHGRVKVQFHWDRRQGQGETKYEKSSCWIRVSQGHAGAGWGMIHIPRKGEEVIVDFLEGDPDQPIITGRVYNGQNRTPYALDDKQKADNIYISGYKSRSSLEGDVAKNYNELTFQDKKGKERVYFHAERDFVRVVENKDVLIVSDKQYISEDRIDQVTKDTKDGSQTIEIFKNRTVTIQTGDDKLEVSEGDRTIEIKKGQHTLDVAKDITIKSGKNINVEAKDDKIEIVVGLSSITMKKDGTITIKGKALTLDAMQTVNIKALQKVEIEGTMGVSQKGLQAESTGQVKATVSGSAMAEVQGGAMTKIAGGVTFVN